MIGLTALAAMAAAGCAGRTRAGPDRRLKAVLAEAAAAESQNPRDAAVYRFPRRLLAAAVALMAGIAVGGLFGILLGAAGAALVALLRLSAPPPTIDPDDVPVVVDLVAGCLAAGASLPDALEAAAVAAGEVMQLECRTVAAALHAGAPPEQAWRGWLGDAWLAPVARTALRTTQTGAAAAEDLRRTSARLRARRRAAAQQRVRQASVWLVVPLGLFFLPAFVLVAVVPLVVGLLPALR